VDIRFAAHGCRLGAVLAGCTAARAARTTVVTCATLTATAIVSSSISTRPTLDPTNPARGVQEFLHVSR
jgi:hypothetical protein